MNAAGPWIAVTPETMPKDRSKVLVAFGDDGVEFGEWHEIKWQIDGYYVRLGITHWAAINEPETDAKGIE